MCVVGKVNRILLVESATRDISPKGFLRKMEPVSELPGPSPNHPAIYMAFQYVRLWKGCFTRGKLVYSCARGEFFIYKNKCRAGGLSCHSTVYFCALGELCSRISKCRAGELSYHSQFLPLISLDIGLP